MILSDIRRISCFRLANSAVSVSWKR